MERLVQIESEDRELLAGIAATMGEAVRRSGAWIACKPGCTQCCIGPFAITALDALRLRRGMETLDREDSDRAARVRERAQRYVGQASRRYPGDAETGRLDDEDALPEFLDEVACPALDPDTGLCEVYAHRPITCRTFGPATRIGGGSFGACELCYGGATDEEIAGCAVEIDPGGLEDRLLRMLESGAKPAFTIVAFALR